MPTQAIIDLYFAPTPNGYKITMALEELGLPYTVHKVDISKNEQFTPKYLAINPNNKIPAIVDPEGPGGKPITVFESGAILLYLARKTGKLMPQDERGRVEVEQWLMWQMAGFGPMLGQAHHFRIYAPEKVQYGIERYTNEAKRLYGVLNTQLAGRDYICGDFSIVDCACYPWARAHERQGIDIAEYPHVAAWLKRSESRASVGKVYL